MSVYLFSIHLCSFDYIMSPVWLKREGKKLLFVLTGAEKNSFDLKKKKRFGWEKKEKLVMVNGTLSQAVSLLKEIENI